MTKRLALLVFLMIPASAYADIAPARDIPCEDCIYRCFDCCTMEDIVPMPGCGSCYRKACDFEKICADYLNEHPDKCPNRVKPADLDKDPNALPEPELKDSDVDNTQPQADNTQPQAGESAQQVPPPVENKRSCSAMVFASEQNGIWALMAAFMLGLLAYLVRRKCR